MADMSLEDISALYLNTLVMYNNKPIFIEAVGRGAKISYLDIANQRTYVVDFEEGIFKSPTRRIGFVNIANSVIYVYRNPVRRYKIGYSAENLRVAALDVRYPISKTTVRERVSSLRVPEISDSFFNRYPSFTEAIEKSIAFEGACAFDKQFALCNRGYVWYKTNKVGSYRRDAKTVYDILFDNKHEHLILLLENNHEKTTSTTRI